MKEDGNKEKNNKYMTELISRGTMQARHVGQSLGSRTGFKIESSELTRFRIWRNRQSSDNRLYNTFVFH